MTFGRSLAATTLAGAVIATAVVTGATASSSGGAPILIHRGTSLLSTGPDADGHVEAGEQFSFNVEIRNVGGVTATGISATLTSNDFSIQQGSSTYPDLPRPAAATNATPFLGTLPTAARCGDGYLATLALTTQQGNSSLPVIIPVSAVTQAVSWTSTTPVPIPDLGVVESPLTIGGISANATIVDLNVRINDLRHPWDADLFISLRPPTSAAINLVSYRGNGPNFLNTVLDDEGIFGFGYGNPGPPFTASFYPDAFPTMLAAIDGVAPTGTWNLRIRDDVYTDQGELRSWGLDAQVAKCNGAPTPAFDAVPQNPIVGRPTTLTATSSDTDGQVVQHAWDLDSDGQFDDGTGSRVTRTFRTAGPTQIGLRAVDNGGNVNSGKHELVVVQAPCRVPRVVGRRLTLARRIITRAGCRVGRVRRARSHRIGRVIRQSPRAGVTRARGTRVNLVVGRR